MIIWFVDGANVRKDGVDADGTIVIIKPDTKSGRSSAKKREELFDKNEETNHRTILYDPANPDYLPGSDKYIGPKKKNK